MIRTKALVAGLAAALFMGAGFVGSGFVGSGASLAAAEPEAPPPIDWRDFIDTDTNGDHVVGEELCAAPGAAESLPDSFVVI